MHRKVDIKHDKIFTTKYNNVYNALWMPYNMIWPSHDLHGKCYWDILLQTLLTISIKVWYKM